MGESPTICDMIARSAVFAGVCVLTSACAGHGQASLINQAAYARANHSLYKRLPVYARAMLVSRTDSLYHQSEADNAPIAGIVTGYVFRLPADATILKVASFYQRRLSRAGWRLRERLPGIPGRAGPVLNFQRDSASVSVNLEGGYRHTLEIDLDKGGTSSQ